MAAVSTLRSALQRRAITELSKDARALVTHLSLITVVKVCLLDSQGGVSGS